MNLFTLSSILNFLSGAAVAAFMFTRHNASKTTVIWGYMGLLTAFWGIGTYIVSTAQKTEIAYLGWQIAKIASVLGPVVHHHFVLENIQLNRKKQLFILYSIATFILLVNFLSKEYFLGDLHLVFDQFYYMDWWSRKNLLYLLYYIGFYWILLFYSFGLILNYYKICPKDKKNSLKYIILGSIIIWVGAHGDFPLVFGIKLYPLSNFLFALSPIIIGYGILKYKTLDIEIVFQRGLIYSVTITLISILFLILVMIMERMFQGFIGYKTTYASILSAIFISLLFAPLRNSIQELIEKYFFKASSIQIAEENALLRQEVINTDKLKAVATLSSGIAHEIRNPLTSLKTFVEYFPKKKNDPEFIAKFESLASTEITRIEKILQELLEFSKPSPLTLTATNINNVITHALNLTSNQLAKNNITVQTDLCANLPIIQADSNKLLQVFINLILNANEAMSADTPTDQLRGRVLKVTTQVKATIEVTITDTGCGIAQKDLAKIFDPFFSTKQSGTGLGLAIVKGIIEEHGGKIVVTSEVGKGTEFMVRLPSSTERHQIA